MPSQLVEKTSDDVFSSLLSERDSAEETPLTGGPSAESVRELAYGADGERRIFVSAPSRSVRLGHTAPSRSFIRGWRVARPALKGASTLRADSARPQLALETGAGSIAVPAPSVLDGKVVYAVSKRLFDIAFSSALLVLLSPLLLLVALAVKLSSRGPAVYRHTRVGKDGRGFTCFKFRTMVADAEARKANLAHLNVHSDSRTFKIPNDPRVTRLGLFLRRTSIDELPQLYNVLRGEMSIVGPRPALSPEVAQYSEKDRCRLMVKPGLTCIWQVSGRSKLAFPQQVELDLDYIEQRSFWLDLKLVVLTIPAVLFSDGAY